MKQENFRQAFAFTLLFLTIGWGVFVIFIVHHAIETGSQADILSTAGATGLLGAMIAWMADIKQFFFRKSPKNNDKKD